MSFINKEDILETVFVDEHTGKILQPNIYAQEFKRDTFTVLLSPYGAEVKYYADDKLQKKFGLNDYLHNYLLFHKYLVAHQNHHLDY